MIRKKDGSLKFCIKYHSLNKVTLKDAQPLPRIDYTLEVLNGSLDFFTLDLRSGYWQIPLREEDKHKTTSQTSS